MDNLASKGGGIFIKNSENIYILDSNVIKNQAITE